MWHALTWRRLAITQGIVALAVFVESFEYDLLGTWLGHPSLHYVAMSVSALVLLVVTLYADGRVSRGAHPRLVYPLTVALSFPAAFVITGLVQATYFAVLAVPAEAAAAHRWVFVSTAEDIALICSFGMVIYMNRRIAERMLEGIQAAELKRLQLEEQLVESRLATAEAQVDPEKLLSSLAAIRDGFSRSTSDADARLDELVQQLRNALTRTARSERGESAAR